MTNDYKKLGLADMVQRDKNAISSNDYHFYASDGIFSGDGYIIPKRHQREAMEYHERISTPILQELASIQSTYQQTVDAAQAQMETAASEIKHEYEAEKQQVELRYQSDHQQLTDQLIAATQAIKDRAQQAAYALGILAEDWGSPAWHSFRPFLRDDASSQLREGYKAASGVPSGVRIGTLIGQENLQYGLTGFPAMVSFIGNGHIVITSNSKRKAAALKLLQSIITRIVVTHPVTSVRLVCVDPVGLGSNFPFKRLPDTISGNTAKVELNEIQQEMRGLIEHMRLVTEKYLAKDYDNIEAYNHDAEEVVESYRILAAADFPVKFDPESCTRLMSIAERGVRTGVYAVIHVDIDQPLPRGFNLEDLLRHSNVIEANDSGFTFKPLGSDVAYAFEPDDLPSPDLFNRLMDQASETAMKNKFSGIPFERVKINQIWNGNSTKSIQVPIGKAGAKDVLSFWLGQLEDGKISVHSLLGGQTGYGKSTLLHVMIINLARHYSPDELQMYLLDFKEGVEFRPYADNRLPHARVISIESEREFALSVMLSLTDEIGRRAALFKQAEVNSITGYRALGHPLPRLLLIVDEFQRIFETGDTVTNRITAEMEVLIKQGRVFGIHVVMGSQSMRGAHMPAKLYGQFATRIALKSPEEDIAVLLSNRSVNAAELLERPGDVLYNDSTGDAERNMRGQIANLRDDDVSFYVQELAKERRARNLPELPQRVFRGDQASAISDNSRLEQLYDAPDWLSTSEIRTRFELRDWVASEKPALFWLGEAVNLKPHTAAAFKRRSRSNMLIVADDEASVFSMIGSGLLSLVLFHRPGQAIFRIIDLGLSEEYWEDTTSNFRDNFQQYDIQIMKRRRSEEMIDELEAIVADRNQKYRAGEEEVGPSIFFVIACAHRAVYLKPTTGRMGPEPSDHAKKLQQIAVNGPEVGVHLILTCDNTKTFEDIMRRPNLSLFDRRVAMRMNKDESQLLLGEPTAESLRPLRALLLDDEEGTSLEKFKPYGLPEIRQEREAVFRSYAERLAGRSGNVEE
jgi:hypothetical protein